MAKIIIDSGPLVALLDDSDQYHVWAKGELARLKPPLLTCDAVLSEVGFLLSAYPRALQPLQRLIEQEILIPDFVSRNRISEIFSLMKSYRSVPMSFADACLVCMVEVNRESVVFTTDSDFTVYRQQRRKFIPLIAPF